MTIKAIFFSRFHPEKGPVVLHQVPDGSIVPSSSSTMRAPLFDFSSISDYIIPRQEFCGGLVSVCANRCRIIGYPVCVVDPGKYDRNEYIFNFAIVLDEDEDMTGYQEVVRMLAALFEDLEVQESLLSSEKLMDADEDGAVSVKNGLLGGRIYSICEMVLEDLNNYSEFVMPIDDRNTLNMKLFPTYTAPHPVQPWHVPLSTARLSTFFDPSWDLTVSRVAACINGVSSVAAISQHSDTDIDLTREAIAHLQYYGCILLLDIFQFSAVYAATATIGNIFIDEALQAECIRYVTTSVDDIDRDVILQLYSSLGHGQAVKAWCADNHSSLTGIDVRRFITFGVIQGFLYRVHKYALNTASSAVSRSEVQWPQQTPDADGEASLGPIPQEHPLAIYLDGMHCFDQICTEMKMSEQAVAKELRRFSDVQIIYR